MLFVFGSWCWVVFVGLAIDCWQLGCYSLLFGDWCVLRVASVVVNSVGHCVSFFVVCIWLFCLACVRLLVFTCVAAVW